MFLFIIVPRHKNYNVTTAHRVKFECKRDMRKREGEKVSANAFQVVTDFKK